MRSNDLQTPQQGGVHILNICNMPCRGREKGAECFSKLFFAAKDSADNAGLVAMINDGNDLDCILDRLDLLTHVRARSYICDMTI